MSRCVIFFIFSVRCGNRSVAIWEVDDDDAPRRPPKVTLAKHPPPAPQSHFG